MNEYHKIPTVWNRDPATNYKTLLTCQWATHEIEYLKDQQWVWTEKIDGTNIRVMWDGENVSFGGKSDIAIIYPPLLARLLQLFSSDTLSKTFAGPACLYGEGFGPRIQKGGGNYGPFIDFILFDVLVCYTWLTRESVADVAAKLGLLVVPVVGSGPLFDAIHHVQNGFLSTFGNFKAEGLVLRPLVELKDRRGHRIISKIKTKDFSYDT